MLNLVRNLCSPSPEGHVHYAQVRHVWKNWLSYIAFNRLSQGLWCLIITCSTSSLPNVAAFSTLKAKIAWVEKHDDDITTRWTPPKLANSGKRRIFRDFQAALETVNPSCDMQSTDSLTIKTGDELRPWWWIICPGGRQAIQMLPGTPHHPVIVVWWN